MNAHVGGKVGGEKPLKRIECLVIECHLVLEYLTEIGEDDSSNLNLNLRVLVRGV